MNKSLSNWRSVRLWESRVARDLRQQRMLWLHGIWIGLIVWALIAGAGLAIFGSDRR